MCQALEELIEDGKKRRVGTRPKQNKQLKPEIDSGWPDGRFDKIFPGYGFSGTAAGGV